MAIQLLRYMPADLENFRPQNRHGTAYGKPNFPEDLDSTDIRDYFGPDSAALFQILRIDPSFLLEPVEKWSTLDSYQAGRKSIKSVHPVNDSAERGCKLASDFKGSARDELRFQYMKEVVENDRDLIPDQRVRHLRK